MSDIDLQAIKGRRDQRQQGEYSLGRSYWLRWKMAVDISDLLALVEQQQQRITELETDRSADRLWLALKAGSKYNQDEPFERGLEVAYQDALMRMIKGDAAGANQVHGDQE